MYTYCTGNLIVPVYHYVLSHTLPFLIDMLWTLISIFFKHNLIFPICLSITQFMFDKSAQYYMYYAVIMFYIVLFCLFVLCGTVYLQTMCTLQVPFTVLLDIGIYNVDLALFRKVDNLIDFPSTVLKLITRKNV